MATSNIIPLRSPTATLKAHELADCFPLMGKDDYKRLCDSIAKGWSNRYPITLYEGKILDGRNRYCALIDASRQDILSRPETFEEFIGSFDEAKTLVITANLARRNLSHKEKIVAGDKIARCGAGNPQFGKFAELEKTSLNQAARLLGISPRSIGTVRQYKKLKADGILKPEEIDQVENGPKPHSWAVKNANKRIADAKKPKTGPRAMAQHAALVRAFRKAVAETEASCVSLVERVKVPRLNPEEKEFAVSALEKARRHLGRLIKTLKDGGE